MPYLDDEQSIESGAPIELYEFISSTGTAYRYTNHFENVTVGPNVYESTVTRRDRLTSVAEGDDVAVTVDLPYDTGLVQDFLFNIPNLGLSFSLYRQHGVSGDQITYWSGEVDTISVEGLIAKVRIPSLLASRLGRSVPTVYYQSQCNHKLYGTRCGVAESTYRIDTSVSAILTDKSVTVASVGGSPDQYFKSGVITRVTDNERRLITDQTGSTLTLNFPFKNLSVSDSIQITAGCDHSATTCRDKFANMVNFGGCNWIPNKNIFVTGLKK